MEPEECKAKIAEIRAKVAKLLKPIKIEDIATFAKIKYGVKINNRYVKSLKTQAVNAEDAWIFFDLFKQYIRNRKFPDRTSKITKVDIARAMNPDYPKTLISDFRIYFNMKI